MKFAIIATGGKQYKVSEGQTYRFENLGKKEGSQVTFDKVLFFSDGAQNAVGRPLVAGAKVKGQVKSVGKSKKVSVVKFKSKVRYRRKKGHRQQFTAVKIEKIGKEK